MLSIEIYSLIGCYFSQKAELMMMDFKLGDRLKIIKVDYDEKEKYKKKNKMNTFPQIFLKNGEKKYKIGGSDQLDNIIRIIKEINTYESNLNLICLFNDLINKKPSKSKKSIKSKKSTKFKKSTKSKKSKKSTKSSKFIKSTKSKKSSK